MPQNENTVTIWLGKKNIQVIDRMAAEAQIPRSAVLRQLVSKADAEASTNRELREQVRRELGLESPETQGE